MPYIQFPNDIDSLLADGLIIRYTRTMGSNGNVSARVLTKIELPSEWESSEKANYKNITEDNFSLKNESAAVNGTDKESLTDAYNNYKKTVGTFDTLVTCRDYMNKIYQLVSAADNTTPLVSNIIVSDIRDDINNSFVKCSFNDFGICYLNDTLKKSVEGVEGMTEPRITHFDLVFYPFTAIKGYSENDYKNSFKYSSANMNEIEADLQNFKTISHNIKLPEETDIFCIKNYLDLHAKITTTIKVTAVEEALIKEAIFSAVYKKFNARNLDFGEEIPFDTILETIQTADPRIKNVALEEPELVTVAQTVKGDEYEISKLGNITQVPEADTILDTAISKSN